MPTTVLKSPTELMIFTLPPSVLRKRSTAGEVWGKAQISARCGQGSAGDDEQGLTEERVIRQEAGEHR